MTQIDIITNSPTQSMTLRLENGQSVKLFLFYSYNQAGWFYSITYGSMAINRKRLVNSLNLLREFRNNIPFGISCLLTDLYEPIFIDDFINGRAKLYLLNSVDVTSIEALIESV